MAEDQTAVAQEVEEELPVPIVFKTPPRMPSVYAHHMFVQPTGNEVVLSFFEIISPILPQKLNDDQLRALREKGITAECVARVTIAKDAFPAFIEAMLTAKLPKGAQGNADNPGSDPES